MTLRETGRALACMAALFSPLVMAAGKCERLVATGSLMRRPIRGKTHKTLNT